MPGSEKAFHFSLRTLLSLASGVAFVGFAIHWLISTAPDGIPPIRHVIFVVPWALGALIGIWAAARRSISTLFGAIVGGVLGTFIFPGLFVIYLYFMGLNGVHSLRPVIELMAMAACGSGLLAAFVGIPREGIVLRPRRQN